jgi:hypothetical protein
MASTQAWTDPRTLANIRQAREQLQLDQSKQTVYDTARQLSAAHLSPFDEWFPGPGIDSKRNAWRSSSDAPVRDDTIDRTVTTRFAGRR